MLREPSGLSVDQGFAANDAHDTRNGPTTASVMYAALA